MEFLIRIVKFCIFMIFGMINVISLVQSLAISAIILIPFNMMFYEVDKIIWIISLIVLFLILFGFYIAKRVHFIDGFFVRSMLSLMHAVAMNNLIIVPLIILFSEIAPLAWTIFSIIFVLILFCCNMTDNAFAQLMGLIWPFFFSLTVVVLLDCKFTNVALGWWIFVYICILFLGYYVRSIYVNYTEYL